MCEMCGIYREVEQCIQDFGEETWVKCHLVGLSVDERIILHTSDENPLLGVDQINLVYGSDNVTHMIANIDS